MRRFGFPLTVGLLLACRTPTAQNAAYRASPLPLRTITEVELTFEVKGKTLPVPMVSAVVNGLPTTLIVDTGASNNVLTTQFASANHIPLEAVQGTAIGHADEALEAKKAVGVRLAIGSLEREPPDVVAVHGPPPFEQFGIGGFLSPQNFASSGFVVLDLPAKRMMFLDGAPEGLGAWVAAHYSGTVTPVKREKLRSSREADARKIFLLAGVDPGTPTLSEMDTGGSNTEFAASYIGMAKGGSADNSGISVSGQVVAGTMVKDQTVFFGGMKFGSTDILVRPKMEGFQGLLGIDILRNLVLIIPVDSSQNLLFIRQPDSIAPPGGIH
jgi:hypothetical protein